MSFCKVTIVGNLTRDPEAAYTQDGTLNVKFGIAADGRKRGENTAFFNVTAWDKAAERILAMQERGYIAKGKLLYVEGQFEQRGYTDRQGQMRTSLDVNLSDWQFVGGKQDEPHAQTQSGYGSYTDHANTPF